MRTEEKGSETHLQKARLQMNTFPLAFPYSSSPLQKKRQPKRDERKRDDSVFSFVTLLIIVFLVCFRVAAAVVRCLSQVPVNSLAFSVLDLHVNYLESKSFMCHIHSLQHISMITLCLNFLNYSTSPSHPPSLWAGKCILPFNCIHN